jgi:hypothetical protein
MNKLISASLVLTALTGFAQTASAASAMMSSDADMKAMNSCMAMSSDAMMKDKMCMDAAKKMNMSDADMKMMKNCKSMSSDAMMKDKDCSMMMSKHADMMKPMK